VIPLRDNLPTLRFPVVTVALIVINVAFFLWQQTLPSDEYSSPQLRVLGVPKSDEAVLQLGAIPYRLTHPGDDCAVGAVPSAGVAQAEVVCQGTAQYQQAQRLQQQAQRLGQPLAAPLVQLDQVPWWVTIFSSLFLHAGLLHIAFNMLFLWVFGNNIEDSMGRPRFVLFYLLAGVVAAYAQSFLTPNDAVPEIGASGAIAGVLGGYALLHPRARVLTLIFIIFFITFVEIPALALLAVWFLLQFVPALGQVSTDVGGNGGVAYLAHVGGFVFGLAAIKLFVKRRPTALPPRQAF
jgi:membrane associated rhomboid family serine protease